MRNEVNARGAKFVVVTLSNGPQCFLIQSCERSSRNVSASLICFIRTTGSNRWARGKDTGLTLAPELQEFAERNHVFLHGFGENIGNGHWNATAIAWLGINCEKMCEGALIK